MSLIVSVKLALQYHPDKNKAPGADEAFKRKCDIRYHPKGLLALTLYYK